MLRSKCILEPTAVEDGLRASTMSRHTLSDGLTEDVRLMGKWDCWLRKLAPPGKLVGAHYRGEVGWDEFCRRYVEHLRRDASPDVEALTRLARAEDVTVMCVERDPKTCHRSLLVEECSRRDPSLKVKIA